MDGAILLRDQVGEKASTIFVGLVKINAVVNVLRGELLVPLPGDEIVPRSDEKKPHNYRVRKDPAVTLYCDPTDVAPLGNYEFLLLEGIQSCSARYEVFLSGDKLDWGQTLKPGSAVYVIVPGTAFSSAAVPIQGVPQAAAKVRYVGGSGTEPGVVFGVEITDKNTRGYGTTDGTFQGRRYFDCKDKCGLFVSLDTISADAEGDLQARKSASGAHVESSVDRFRPEDRVVAYNSKNVPIHGTVRWVGNVTDGKGGSIAVVGIETDIVLPKKYFNDAIPVITPMFKVRDSRHGKVYLPQAFVKEEGAAAKDRLKALAKQLSEPTKSLQEAEKTEEAKEFQQLQHAVPEDIDVKEQREALLAMERENEEKKSARPRAQINPPPVAMVPPAQPDPQSQVALYYDQSQAQGRAPQQSSHPDIPRAQINPQPVAMAPPAPEGNAHLYTDLGIGSTVQVSDPPRYGVIRWMGELPEVQGTIAGVELEENMNGCADGTWRGTRYFTCPYEKGMFCPFNILKPDQRFALPGTTPSARTLMNPLIEFPMEEPLDQTIGFKQIAKYLGEGRGIQGHQNSCYLDATVFGLFALSYGFDDVFQGKAKDPAWQEIQKMLLEGIVNPLRNRGVVRHESVMRLRNKLEELGKMKGVNMDEKDPEEFLNMLFKHTLDGNPFISIKRPFGVQQEYFVRLFLEDDKQMKLPTVGELLWKMFTEQDIFFTRVPSKLLIQVPRYGKQFKTYKKIIPDLKLDVRGLVVSPCKCFICHKSAWKECSDCVKNFIDEKSLPSQFVLFCNDCSKMVHTNRPGHHVKKCLGGGVTELELLSVICIETSHYVCFSRSEDRWIFSDSMASRVYDLYNIPKGVECTRELNEWVYSGDHQRLMDTPPRKLPEYVRQFTQDVYMCVYIQPEVGMYKVEDTSPQTVLTNFFNNLLRKKQARSQRSIQAKNEAELDRLQAMSDHHAPSLGIMDPPADVCQEIPRQLNVRQEFLEKENATLKSQLVQLQESLSEQREETQKHKQELDGVQAKYLRLASDMEQEAQQNQKAQQRLQEECSQLQGQRDEALRSEQELRQQVERFQGQRDEALRSEQEFRQQVERFQGQRDEALRSEQELRQQVERFQDRLQTTQAEMQQLRSAPQVTTQEVEFWKVPRREVQIASHIGEGAWGYVAKGTFRGQDVAVKWPHERLLDPYTINRLRREVRIMAQVRHPHLLLFIAAVFDREADRLEAPPMIITELLAMNLREAYKTGKLQGASKLSIYRDIACALNYLHQHQEPIIHRDVSAPNVLLEALPDGMWRAKLSDFGSANLAKLAQTMGEGAIIYSAPETIPALVHDPDAPAPPQTVKLDVYSYGVLLCEVTTSQFPDPEQYRTMLQQIQRQWQFIYNLIVSCTKRAPEERPTMAWVLGELNKLPRRKIGPHHI